MTEAAKYVKLVEWPEEDGAFAGQCPRSSGPCCHGPDEVEVYRELCEIVAEWIEIARRDGQALPAPPESPAGSPDAGRGGQSPKRKALLRKR